MEWMTEKRLSRGWKNGRILKGCVLMFKNFSMFILRKEIADIKRQRDEHMQNYGELLNKYIKISNEYADYIKKCSIEMKRTLETIAQLKKENEIMREYYHLDQEPSEDIQAKVLLNIRCHDLEREITNLKIQASENLRLSYYLQEHQYQAYPRWIGWNAL